MQHVVINIEAFGLLKCIFIRLAGRLRSDLAGFLKQQLDSNVPLTRYVDFDPNFVTRPQCVVSPFFAVSLCCQC